MPRYLISFDDGSMDHIPEEDWPAVGEASHAVVREAKAAEVWIVDVQVGVVASAHGNASGSSAMWLWPFGALAQPAFP